MSIRAYIAAVNLGRACTGLAVGPSCVGPEREVAIRASSPYERALSGSVIEPDPRHCYAVVVLVLCYCYASGMLLLCYCYAIVMLLLCYCYAAVMLLLCYCYATVML